MAALTGVTSATLDDLVQGTSPDIHVYTTARNAAVFDLFLYLNRLESNEVSRTFASLGALAADSGVKTQLDAFADQALSSGGTSLEITGPIGLTVPISDMARDKSKGVEVVTQEAPAAMYDRIHTDAATLAGSLTNTSTPGTTLNLAAWGSSLLAFKAQKPGVPFWTFIARTEALGALDAEMRATAAQYGAISVGWLQGAGQLAGVRGSLDGVLIAESGNIPQADASNWNSFFAAGTELTMEPNESGHSGLIGGPMAMVYDLDQSGNFMRTEMERIGERAATRMTVSARYTVGIVFNGRGRKVTTLKA